MSMKLPYSHIKAIYGLLGKTGLTDQKPALCYSFSNGRVEGVSDLKVFEANELIRYLTNELNKAGNHQAESANQMRRKILSLCHRMKWETTDGKVDMNRLNDWCRQSGYLKKELREYTYVELPKLVSQFTLVYQYFLKKTLT